MSCSLSLKLNFKSIPIDKYFYKCYSKGKHRRYKVMYYTIGEVAKMFNLTPSTIRYYDKEGLLPFVERQSGIRKFSQDDVNMLKTIECLKETGMPIKDIKIFSQWCLEGDCTLNERLEMFYQRREIVKQQMADLQDIMDHIEYKCNYYEKAVAANSESIHKNSTKKEINESISILKGDYYKLMFYNISPFLLSIPFNHKDSAIFIIQHS